MSSVSSVTATSVSPTQGASAIQQQKIAKDLKALATALKANDTKAAQAAMIQLQIDTNAASTSGTTAQATDPLSKVASALQSVDLSTAQNEFAKFESAALAYANSNSSAA